MYDGTGYGGGGPHPGYQSWGMQGPVSSVGTHSYQHVSGDASFGTDVFSTQFEASTEYSELVCLVFTYIHVLAFCNLYLFTPFCDFVIV